jgi:hypothetical protein
MGGFMTIKMNQTTADCGTGWRYDGALSRLAAAVDFEIQLVGLDPHADSQAGRHFC